MAYTPRATAAAKWLTGMTQTGVTLEVSALLQRNSGPHSLISLELCRNQEKRMNQACVGRRGGEQDVREWTPGSALSGGSLSSLHFKLSQISRSVVWSLLASCTSQLYILILLLLSPHSQHPDPSSSWSPHNEGFRRWPGPPPCLSPPSQDCLMNASA